MSMEENQTKRQGEGEVAGGMGKKKEQTYLLNQLFCEHQIMRKAKGYDSIAAILMSPRVFSSDCLKKNGSQLSLIMASVRR